MKKKILAVAVHPDDETLGCGGSLLKHKADGDELYWLILTGMKDVKVWTEHRIHQRRNEIEKVAKSYGMAEVVNLGYETTRLDEVPLGELTGSIAEVLQKLSPEIIYLHNRSDIHSDHRVSFEAIMSAAKSFKNEDLRTVLMYETLSETDFAPALQENAFLPNYFVDISETLEHKIDIMKLYSTEVGEHPFPRSEKSLRALATLRGAQSGVMYAEAFMLLKHIRK